MLKPTTIGPEREGYVKFIIMDAVTGKRLDEIRGGYLILPEEDPFDKNTCTLDARRGAAHNLVPDDNQFKLTRVEWGWGATTTARSDTDLSGPFATPVYTAINSYSFPTADENVLKVLSVLTNEVLVFPDAPTGPSSPPYTYIREVALRSNPAAGYPKGLAYARFVAEADIPKTSDRINIGLEWLYIYL